MSVMSSTCHWIITHRAEGSFRTREIVDDTGIDTSQVSNALRTLTDTGAIRIVTGNSGRGGNVYQVRDLQAVRLRTFIEKKPAATAPEPVAPTEDEAGEDEEHLTFAIDHDGDLQILRPDGSMTLIDNANARRLVAFVALQASAILMAGAQ